jgi:vacuolar-type H+-ATPase subunit C/Vma6
VQETVLKEFLGPGAAWSDFSALADRCFHEAVVSIRADCPDPLPANLFLLAGDYLNLKNVLAGKGGEPFPGCFLSPETLAEIAQGDLSGLPRPLLEAEAGFAADATDARSIDIALDGAYLRHLLSLGGASGSALIAAYTRESARGAIVTMFWRALKQGQPLRRFCQQLLPLGEFTPLALELAASTSPDGWPALLGTELGDLIGEALNLPDDERISGFALMVSNRNTRIAKEGKMQTAGPERVFAFLEGFRNEVYNLRLAVNGRLSGIAPDALRQRLREAYA